MQVLELTTLSVLDIDFGVDEDELSFSEEDYSCTIDAIRSLGVLPRPLVVIENDTTEGSPWCAHSSERNTLCLAAVKHLAAMYEDCGLVGCVVAFDEDEADCYESFYGG